MADELGHAARVGGRQHGLLRAHGLDGDEAVVLLLGNERHEQRPCVFLRHLGVRQPPEEPDRVAARGEPAQPLQQRAFPGDAKRDGDAGAAVGLDDQIDALGRLEPARGEDRVVTLVMNSREDVGWSATSTAAPGGKYSARSATV